MNRRQPTSPNFFVLIVVGLALGLAGCGADGQFAPPTQALGIDDGQSARVTATPEAAPAVQGDHDGYAWGPGGPSRVFSLSCPIDGAVGGVVEFGRCTLTFPPGAFEGTETITIECDNSAFVECRLYPEGLQFSRPVQLAMVLKGHASDGPGATIYWWDPSARSWVDLMGAYTPQTHTVTADLQHFSTYSAGRAGW